MANIFQRALGGVEGFLDRRINQAQSATTSQAAETAEVLAKRAFEEDGQTVRGRKGLIIDPFFGMELSAGSYRPKRGSLSNAVLKMASRQDPCVSTIINVRASQVMGFCRKQESHYDIGYVIKPKNEEELADPSELEQIYEFINNCGNKDARKDTDKLTFGQFGYMIAADFLRYGYCTVEKDSFLDDTLNAFFPLPAETIYFAGKNVPKAQIDSEVDSNEKLIQAVDPDYQPEDEADQAEHDDEQYQYVQVINGKTYTAFYKSELVFARFTPDNDIDLNGYAIGPLERAIQMVSNHLKVENHQSMFFTHGMASRGLLVIQGDVTPNALRALQAQWTQQVNGGANAWRTPVLGGIKGVQWIPLQPTNRDMEYAAYQDHLLRTIHACFGIDPEETGYGYLSKGTEQRSLGEANNEWKIEASRDRGLRPMLTRIEEIMNEEILPAAGRGWADKYRFCFAGLDADTRTEETARLQAETSLHTTLGEARSEAQKEPIPYARNLILNPLLLQYLQANMTKGMFMEYFMGIEGASQRPDLAYIPDPFWFQWQQVQLQMMQMQAGVGPDGGDGEDSDEGDEEQGDEKDVEKAEEQRALMQQAAQDFMAANPELFKSMNESLAKSKALHRNVTPITAMMLRKYKAAGNRLVADVLDILKEDGVTVGPKKD